MVGDLKPYPSMKESGVLWLGKVPDHWSVLPNRALFAEIKDRNHPDEEMLSVAITKGVMKQKELLADSSKKDGSNLDRAAYKLVQPRDIAYNKMRAWQGAIGASDDRGIISPAYVVMRLRGDANPRYFHHLYRTPLFAKEAERWSYGITSDMWSLRPEHFRLIYSPLPPREEQDAIVQFVEHADRRIQRCIRAKLKLVKCLEEQKQTIIHRAVTRGLDPSVPIKPSGVPWLGDIPRHWELRKMRYLSRQVVDGTHFTPAYKDDGVAFIRVTDIHDKVIDQTKLRRISREEHLQLNKRCNPEKGDLLLSKNGTIGLTTVVDWDFPFSIFVSLCLIKPIKSLVSADFISFAFAGGLLMQQLADNTKTTSVTNLHLDKIRGLLLPLPPLQEQLEILIKTSEHVTPIVRAVGRLQREIELLRESRTRLVADLVTGKLDAREAATHLPEEAAPDTAEGDTEPIIDPEAADEESVA
jgi:type I restriction enzyme S subunit